MYNQEAAGAKFSQGSAFNTARETIEISPRLSANVVRYREQTWCHIFETNKRSKTVSFTPADLRYFFGKESALKAACRRAYEADNAQRAPAEQKRNGVELNTKDGGQRKRLSKESCATVGKARRKKNDCRSVSSSDEEESPAEISSGWN